MDESRGNAPAWAAADTSRCRHEQVRNLLHVTPLSPLRRGGGVRERRVSAKELCADDQVWRNRGEMAWSLDRSACEEHSERPAAAIQTEPWMEHGSNTEI